MKRPTQPGICAIGDFTGKGAYKPKNDRWVHSLGIACPVCGAGVEEPCHRLDGGSARLLHPARRRMALRAGLYYVPLAERPEGDAGPRAGRPKL